MSWLFIDSADSARARIGLLTIPRVRVWSVRGRSRGLLRALAMRVPLSAMRAVDGVCVVHGPGSFSSVRGGVMIANLLARLLQKPLVGVHRAQAENLTALAKRLASHAVPVSVYVMPTYATEPHITISPCPL